MKYSPPNCGVTPQRSGRSVTHEIINISFLKQHGSKKKEKKSELKFQEGERWSI